MKHSSNLNILPNVALSNWSVFRSCYFSNSIEQTADLTNRRDPSQDRSGSLAVPSLSQARS